MLPIYICSLFKTQISMTACDFIFNDGTKQQVTAREGKPILIVEEGDTETCKWAEHSLEVTSYTSLDPDNIDCQPCLKEKVAKYIPSTKGSTGS